MHVTAKATFTISLGICFCLHYSLSSMEEVCESGSQYICGSSDLILVKNCFVMKCRMKCCVCTPPSRKDAGKIRPMPTVGVCRRMSAYVGVCRRTSAYVGVCRRLSRGGTFINTFHIFSCRLYTVM